MHPIIRPLERVIPGSIRERGAVASSTEAAEDHPRGHSGARGTVLPRGTLEPASDGGTTEYVLAVLTPVAAAAVTWYLLRFIPLPNSSLLVLLALALLAYQLPPKALRVGYMAGVVAVLLPLMAPSSANVTIEATMIRWVSFAGISGVVMYLLSRLHRQHDRLNELDHLKGTFVALANHELRTPVSVVHASLDILTSELEDRLSREEEAFLRAARSSSATLVHLIDMLTQFDALERAPSPAGERMLPLEEIAGRTIDGLAHAYEETGVELNVNIDPIAARRGVPEPYTTIILEQLLTNAAKFNAPGGHASLQSYVDQGELVLKVADDGWGIPSVSHDSIFESFYQPGDVTNRAAGGLGLGLALVKVAVQRIGGSIQVDSSPGEGSSFTVRLPDPNPRDEAHNWDIA